MKPNEQTQNQYPGIVINDYFSTEDTTGMQLEYKGMIYRVSNINLLLEEEKAELIEGIKNTHNLFVDEYQKFYKVGIDQNTLGIIDILPGKSINISYETPDQEFPTLNAKIGATVNYFDVLSEEYQASEQHQDTEAEGGNNENSSAGVILDADGSVDSEESAAIAAEHNAPDQLQNMEAEGGDNTDAPSLFSTFFSTIGDFFSSVFSSIFSFIFGPDSEEKEEDQQPPQVSDPLASNSVEVDEEAGEERAIEENPVSNSLASNSVEVEAEAVEELAIAENQLRVSDPLDSDSVEVDEEAVEELAIEENQLRVSDPLASNSVEVEAEALVDDSTFSISSIFSTIGSYLGLSKMGSYLGLSKMGSYLSSIFSSDEEEEDSQQLQNVENLPPYPSQLDVPAEDLDVPHNTDPGDGA